jgi:hypothetical protein
MDQARRTPDSEPVDDGQVERAERGVVAGYIHELSERHTEHAQGDVDSDESEG